MFFALERIPVLDVFGSGRTVRRRMYMAIPLKMNFTGGNMGIQSHFDKFHNKIKLGRKDDAYRHARERDDSITKAVKESFKEAGYPVASDFIQGSLATNTAIIAIAGDSDVDRALVLNADDAPSNPVDPKQNALESFGKTWLQECEN